MKDKKINTLWTHLHWLSVLAQQGSYTAAAARLGVSKAAMSQRIAELERAAKVTLVQRTTRSLRLTEAGQRLVEDTRASFAQIEHSFSQVRDLAEQPSGLVRVTTPVALARQQLVPLFVDFLKNHPDVRIELDMSDRLSALATEGFDLAIRHTPAHPTPMWHGLYAKQRRCWWPRGPIYGAKACRNPLGIFKPTTACITPAHMTHPPGRLKRAMRQKAQNA